MRKVAKVLEVLKKIGEWVLVFVAAFVLSLVLRNFVIDGRVVPTGSMLPTIQLKDHVMVDRLFYKMGDLERGDIIVFMAPEHPDLADLAGQAMVKRLIGLPGETVEVRDGYVWIDGRVLNEPYVISGGKTASEFASVKVPEGCYFVLGDNREGSKDSRTWGFLDQKLVIGHVLFCYWPLENFGGLAKPPAKYFDS